MIQRSFKKIVHYVKFTTVCLNFRPCKILVSYLSTIFTYISRDLLPCPLNFQTVLSDLHPAPLPNRTPMQNTFTLPVPNIVLNFPVTFSYVFQIIRPDC